MRDDQRCQICLTHSSREGNLTLYHLQLRYRNTLYQITYRYSKLRLIALTLPQINTPFPAPQHLEKFISIIVGNETFLRQRLEKLKAYFEAVSQSSKLESSAGVLRMVEQGKKVSESDEEQVELPKAPVLKGKQLSQRTCDGNQALLVC